MMPPGHLDKIVKKAFISYDQNLVILTLMCISWIFLIIAPNMSYMLALLLIVARLY